MSYSSRPFSSNNRTRGKFYSTTLRPISYYSPKINNIPITTYRTYTLSNSLSYLCPEKNRENNKKKIRSSPFYNREKSLRIQDEIDWINNLIIRKNKINKFGVSNSNNYFSKDEEKENPELMRSRIRLNQINQIYNDINEITYKEFKYNDYKDNNCPLITLAKYKKNEIFSKSEIDNYNHKVFMNQMNNFKKNYGINRWKNDFKNKFKDY